MSVGARFVVAFVWAPSAEPAVDLDSPLFFGAASATSSSASAKPLSPLSRDEKVVSDVRTRPGGRDDARDDARAASPRGRHRGYDRLRRGSETREERKDETRRAPSRRLRLLLRELRAALLERVVVRGHRPDRPRALGLERRLRLGSLARGRVVELPEDAHGGLTCATTRIGAVSEISRKKPPARAASRARVFYDAVAVATARSRT